MLARISCRLLSHMRCWSIRCYVLSLTQPRWCSSYWRYDMGSLETVRGDLALVILYLNKAEARDKICRAIQYGSKFLSNGEPGPAQNVDKSTSLARKVFRLFKVVFGTVCFVRNANWLVPLLRLHMIIACCSLSTTSRLWLALLWKELRFHWYYLERYFESGITMLKPSSCIALIDWT
jgi:hypothetical protein